MNGPDLVVVGAGPAGAAAALAAAEAGLDVTLVDEAEAPGGQIYRAPAVCAEHPGPEARAGAALRAALAGSRVRVLSDRRVWTLSREPLRVSVSGQGGSETIAARAIVLATGATERVVPFPGWTLPGIIGLAGATILLKSQGVLPRPPVVVAGCGPLLAAVAAGILEGGGQDACIVDLASPADWAAAVPGLLRQPHLLARGLGWAMQIRRAGVPVLFRHAVTEAHGRDVVEAVTVSPVDRQGRPDPDPAKRRRIACGSLAVGHGLVPAVEAAALLGIDLDWVPDRGGWVPRADGHGRTSAKWVYVAGDGAGVRGAAATDLSGRLAGLAAARDLGAIEEAAFGRLERALRRRLARADMFGAVTARLASPRAGLVAAIPPDTIVCRCEDLTRGEIEAAFDAGAADLAELKGRTRCGMGPCGGRICGPTVQALAALRPRIGEPVRPWTARPPLRPIAIGELVGGFEYTDIPVEKPAI